MISLSRTSLAVAATLFVGATQPAAALTFDFSFTGGFTNELYTVEGTISGLADNTANVSSVATVEITSITPNTEPQTLVGLTGSSSQVFGDFYDIVVDNGQITGFTSFGSPTSEIQFEMSNNTSFYLGSPSDPSARSNGGGFFANGVTTYTLEPTAVPAPAALAVFVPALFGLGVARKRRVGVAKV